MCRRVRMRGVMAGDAMDRARVAVGVDSGGFPMSVEAGLFVVVIVAAVGLFVKTRRSGALTTTTIAHAAEPASSERRR